MSQLQSVLRASMAPLASVARVYAVVRQTFYDNKCSHAHGTDAAGRLSALELIVMPTHVRLVRYADRSERHILVHLGVSPPPASTASSAADPNDADTAPSDWAEDWIDYMHAIRLPTHDPRASSPPHGFPAPAGANPARTSH